MVTVVVESVTGGVDAALLLDGTLPASWKGFTNCWVVEESPGAMPAALTLEMGARARRTQNNEGPAGGDGGPFVTSSPWGRASVVRSASGGTGELCM